jgi:sugar lactone lactonase YvrE
VDSTGNVYISDTDNQRVREVTTDGNINTFAGTGVAGFSGDGAGPASAKLSSPSGLALDSSGNLYIADFANNVVREVSSGIILTIAGAFNAGYFGDGTAATSALLNSPASVALDSAGNLYIADSYNHAIRKVTLSTKIISTVAGNGTPGYSGDGSAATGAQLFLPWGVAVDSSGNIFIGDSGNNVIREVGSSNITTVAGNFAAGPGYRGDGGSATGALLNGPGGVAVSSSGSVYIADTNNNVIRLLTAAGSHAVLSVTVTHSGFFQPGQAGAYSVVVSNGTGAGATSGAVTVTATPAAGLTVGSMSGTGWSCSGSTCTRSDALGAASSYPAITVTGSVAAGSGSSVAIQIAVTGGGSPAAGASDAAAVLGAPPAPVLISPTNGLGLVSTAAGLSWTSTGASSYQVFLGTSSAPSQVATTTVPSYTPPAGLSPGTTYYWQIVAVNPAGTASSAVWSFTTGFVVSGLQFIPAPPCRVVDTRNPAGVFGGPMLAAGSMRSFAIPQGACNIPGTAQAYSLNVTVVPQGPLPYLTLWPAGLAQPGVSTLNSTGGTVVANAAIVPAGAAGGVSVFAAGTTDVILDIDGYFAASGGSSFYRATPCRVADTRSPTGQFGGPSLSNGETRDFPIPLGSCAIPSGASAYSLNVTAVPNAVRAFLGYLTTWATGQPRPLVSTLNSWTGTVVANMAIVPAGSNGSVSVFVTDPADVILDTNGYFAQPGGAGALSFYPVTPCRVADTRFGPILGAQTTRSFSIPASGCPVSPLAVAYSLNITAVPAGPLSYLTAWPTGSPQPFVSTLNALDGEVTANAAIVPVGTSGAISIYVTDPTHVILDINGYFAP